MIDLDRWLPALLELEHRALAQLEDSLGRPARSTSTSVGLLYGCLSEETGRFVPFPCPDATHARVTVTLVEE